MEIDRLINKDNPLDKSYVPNDLITTDNNENNFHKYVDKNSKPIISSIILPYFIQMQKDLLKEGYHIIVDSGYRSYEYQEKVLNDNLLKYGDKAYQKVALPGISEHQSGLAIDIAYMNNGIYSDDVIDTDYEVNWLKNNAHKYGFILRYPKGKENITKYKYEPWHYRFVGIEVATICYQNNLTLEEYTLNKDKYLRDPILKKTL